MKLKKPAISYPGSVYDQLSASISVLSSSPGPPTALAGTVNTGARTVQDAAEAALAPATGLVPLAFYSATNASGQMFRPGPAAAISIVLPFRAQVRALSVVASAADTGTYTVYRDGVATSAVVTLAAETSDYETFAIETASFSEGQTLDVRASGVSSANPVEVIVWVSLDSSTVL